MRNLHDYFLATAEVWRAYFDGSISAQAREAHLFTLRKVLPTLPPSKR